MEDVMSKSTLTRRALVASTAAIPAAAALPVAAAQAAEPDPIFTAIARYRAACDAFNAFNGPEDGPQRAALEQAFHEATGPALDTVPTTLAGMKAKIDFITQDEETSEYLTSPGTNEPLRDFLNTLYESARLLARVS
jgi:uncharacterized protein (DUF1501 family)